jgi:hypothetical protein
MTTHTYVMNRWAWQMEPQQVPCCITTNPVILDVVSRDNMDEVLSALLCSVEHRQLVQHACGWWGQLAASKVDLALCGVGRLL